MNTSWAHAPNKKGPKLCTGLFAAPVGVPALELSQSGSRVLTRMMQVNSRAINLSGECWESSSVEHRKLTRTRDLFPQQMLWHQHYSSQTRLLRRKQNGCSPKEILEWTLQLGLPHLLSLPGDKLQLILSILKPHLGLSRMPGWVTWKVCKEN